MLSYRPGLLCSTNKFAHRRNKRLKNETVFWNGSCFSKDANDRQWAHLSVIFLFILHPHVLSKRVDVIRLPRVAVGHWLLALLAWSSASWCLGHLRTAHLSWLCKGCIRIPATCLDKNPWIKIEKKNPKSWIGDLIQNKLTKADRKKIKASEQLVFF